MAKSRTYICDACNGAYTGTLTDIAEEGWIRHTYGVTGKGFMMCGECEERFGRLWELDARKEKKKSA